MNRSFVHAFVSILAVFTLYHIGIWVFYTSKILKPDPYYVGDLGRMSYQLQSIDFRQESYDLPKRHFDHHNWNQEPIDVITIGDSFSNAMASGKNPYYQDYLSSEHHLNVLNIQNLDESFNYIESLTILYNSGWLQHVHPKAIIIETVGSGAFRRVVSNRALPSLSHPELKIFNKPWPRSFPIPLFINTANYKAPWYSLLYHWDDNAGGKVYRFDLNQSLFSVPANKQLLVYHEDLDNISDFTDENINNLNTTLNTLAKKLQTLNIKLYYMPAVDKYDLYYEYIVNKQQYPKNPFFDKLRQTPKEYIFIDTKQIFTQELTKHTQDLYYADDTHWSYKASQALSKSPYFNHLH